MIRSLIRSDKTGTAAIEFALALPILALFLFGTIQTGLVYYADAGLRAAVAESARLATLYPTPTDGQLISRFNNKKFGLDRGTLGSPQISRGVSEGKPYIEITATYTDEIELYFVPTISVTMDETRRAYIQAD